MECAPWGQVDGNAAHLWRCTAMTALGRMEVAVSDYGATLQSLIVADAAGRPVDVVLGHDTLAEYVAGETYFGAIAGRYGNRIRDGRLMIDGICHGLDRNAGAHHLHGGRRGFDRCVWQGVAEGGDLVFRLSSPDGDMGYPGRLDITVRYRITPAGGLDIDMTAVTDRATVCNPVQHSYFNLAGQGDISGHIATIPAAFYTPVDDDLLATGEVLSVAGTPFDFRQPKPFGRDMRAASPRAAPDTLTDTLTGALTGVGYDHNLVLGLPDAGGLRPCATVFSPESGLGLRLVTSEPGVQLYTGGDLSAQVIGKGGRPSVPFGGFTLETQKFPCSPAFGHFGQAILRPGETYHHRMQFRFFHGMAPA